MTPWKIRGPEYGSCNCIYSCPCQFSYPEPTHGFCEAFAVGIVEEGFYGDVDLTGVKWGMFFHWPGPISEGNGKQQFVVDVDATPEQREAILNILSGKDTEEFATHFYVFNTTISEFNDPIIAKMDIEIDVDNRIADVNVDGVGYLKGRPIRDDVTGEPHRVRIDLPNGFEYRLAEIGAGFADVKGAFHVKLNDTYGQFCELHLNNQGVID